MLHSVESLFTPGRTVDPERARFSAALARIQRRLVAAGLDREVTLIVSPGEFSLRAPIEGADHASLRITIPSRQLLMGNPDALADGFVDAYRAVKRWELESTHTAPAPLTTSPATEAATAPSTAEPKGFVARHVLQRA